MAEKTTLGARVDVDLKARLQAAADAKRWTLSAYVEHALRKADAETSRRRRKNVTTRNAALTQE